MTGSRKKKRAVTGCTLLTSWRHSKSTIRRRSESIQECSLSSLMNQKPTVYTNFLLGSRTCFFLLGSAILGKRRCLGAGFWVLESHFALCLYSKELLAWHSMARSLCFYTLPNYLQTCNWKTGRLILYPQLLDAACMFLPKPLIPGVGFCLHMADHPIECIHAFKLAELRACIRYILCFGQVANDSAAKQNSRAEDPKHIVRSRDG
jgi:hypothetical protein